MSSERLESRGYYDALWSGLKRLDQHHKCRIHAIEKLLISLQRPDDHKRRILELGCGSGMVSALLSRFGHVVGVDQSKVGIEIARARVQGRFIIGTLPDIPVLEGDFDVCVLSQVIEHFEDEDQLTLLRQAREEVLGGGHLILTTPNRPVSMRMRFRRGELQPIENWLSPEDLKKRLERTGWRIIRIGFAFSFLPVLSSRHAVIRGLRFLLYDLFRLRATFEDMLEKRPIGDCIVVLAQRP